MKTSVEQYAYKVNGKIVYENKWLFIRNKGANSIVLEFDTEEKALKAQQEYEGV